MKIWIWSDLHLFHDNVIKYEDRPFDTVNDMNQYLINEHRRKVHKKETIFNLGDVALRCSKEELGKIIRNLPGNKILIMGNHDRSRSVQWWEDVGFNEVYKYPIVYKNFYFLSHEPMYMNNHMPYMNIHGHTHSSSYDSTNHINVSVEKLNYTPHLFDDIVKQHLIKNNIVEI